MDDFRSLLIAKIREYEDLKRRHDSEAARWAFLCKVQDAMLCDLRGEVGRLSRIIHDMRNPEKPLSSEWAIAIQRVSADYHSYSRRGYPFRPAAPLSKKGWPQ